MVISHNRLPGAAEEVEVWQSVLFRPDLWLLKVKERNSYSEKKSTYTRKTLL